MINTKTEAAPPVLFHTLADGRTLAYAIYGDSEGLPVLYFHGGNGSRIEAQWFDAAAHRLGVKIIAPDRPGFGLSTFQPGRTFLDWADDVQALADSLKIERFAVFGLSGGAPHVAAVMHRLPERITRAAIISGVAPPEAPGRFQGMWFPVRLIFFFSRWLPFMKRIALSQMGKFYSDAEQMRKMMLRGLPKPDVEYMTRNPEAVDIFSADAREAHRSGIDGDAWEWQLYVRDWGFRLEDIQREIGLWYGRYDVMAPVSMGQFYARVLPHSHLTIVEDGAHFSTINNYIDDILTYLKG